MQVVGSILWWYTKGWMVAGKRVALWLDGFLDYFSFDLLIRTLFSPFRQISAGQVDGPLTVKFRAFIDQLISRVIGAIARLIILLIGAVTLIVCCVLGLAYLLVWPLIPALPIVGLVMTLTGWIPWTIL